MHFYGIDIILMRSSWRNIPLKTVIDLEFSEQTFAAAVGVFSG